MSESYMKPSSPFVRVVGPSAGGTSYTACREQATNRCLGIPGNFQGGADSFSDEASFDASGQTIGRSSLSSSSSSSRRARGLRLTRVFGVSLIIAAIAGLAVRYFTASFPVSPMTGQSSKCIADIRVGDRVPPEAGVTEPDLEFGENVDFQQWRKLKLMAPKEDGSWAEVYLLRPVGWVKDERAEVGGKILLSVPECGIWGDSEVLSIGSCPSIKRGKGHVVTGTFKHIAPRIINIFVEGQTDPIGTTPTHLFWSSDRNLFVRADQLAAGERLASLKGNPRVVRVLPQSGPEYVFNLEVQVSHVYRVSEQGILVHNGLVCPKFKFKGAVRVDSLRTATDAIIRGAFGGTGFAPSSHFLMRIRDARLTGLGLRSFQDLERIFRYGREVVQADGTIAIVYNGVAVIVNPKTKVLITITPW